MGSVQVNSQVWLGGNLRRTEPTYALIEVHLTEVVVVRR